MTTVIYLKKNQDYSLFPHYPSPQHHQSGSLLVMPYIALHQESFSLVLHFKGCGQKKQTPKPPKIWCFILLDTLK